MRLPVLPNLHPVLGRRYMAIFRHYQPTGPSTRKLVEFAAPIDVSFVEHSDASSAYSWHGVDLTKTGSFGGTTWFPTPKPFSVRLVADIGPTPPALPRWNPKPGDRHYDSVH